MIYIRAVPIRIPPYSRLFPSEHTLRFWTHATRVLKQLTYDLYSSRSHQTSRVWTHVLRNENFDSFSPSCPHNIAYIGFTRFLLAIVHRSGSEHRLICMDQSHVQFSSLTILIPRYVNFWWAKKDIPAQ